MAEICDTVLDAFFLSLPVSLLARTSRMAIDIGGSLAKYVVCPDEEWRRAENQNLAVANCTCLTFPRDAIGAAADVILSLMTPSTGREVFATGVGSTEFRAEIESKFGIRIKIQYEIDEVVRGLLFTLRHLSLVDVVHPVEINLQLINSLVDINSKYVDLHDAGVLTWKCHRLIEGYADDQMKTLCQPPQINDRTFPCIVAMCGSMHGYQLVQLDGSYSAHDVDYMGGKTLLGLSSLLLGTQDFKAILRMASEGNAARVDLTDADFSSSSNDADDPYSAVFSSSAPSAMFLPFAKISEQNKDAIAKEDIAASLLNLFVVKLVDSVRSAVAATKVGDVFLCGSFVNFEQMRKKIAVEIQRRDILFFTFNGQHLNFNLHFLRHAAYLCSLGMLVSQADEAMK
ncbi:hypothetical protein CAPTEDRAFT_198065 [Capitella teleta]|uniref:Uncharacterized protein n=1 Tax=Capitella teleta TaxID=283909 RepID=X1ZY95_CAPTE|nr:hypothetical protein CAPTEDRAFT_198065 [Capitella teleta]|eukprot:ELU04618.1 hypothetical protein CAPTEDRAFT_198065 [Capitella teleta]